MSLRRNKLSTKTKIARRRVTFTLLNQEEVSMSSKVKGIISDTEPRGDKLLGVREERECVGGGSSNIGTQYISETHGMSEFDGIANGFTGG
jgi:hypothetical protein